MSELPTWLSTWTPPGPHDQRTDVFLGPAKEAASFPDGGIGLFEDVDDESFWFRHRGRVIVDRAVEAGGAGGAVLEVGSGSGAVVGQLAEAGFDVMAVEPTPGGAARARVRGASVAFEGTLHEAQLPAGVFDLVGFFDVIEHLDDWRDVLVEARRVLRPTGRLLVTVPAHQWLWSEHDDWNEHKRRYSKHKLVADLQDAGFLVDRVSHFFAPLLLPAIVRRSLYRAGRRDGRTHDERLRTQLRPSRIVNTVLLRALRFEGHLLTRRDLAVGTSLFAVASPRSGEAR